MAPPGRTPLAPPGVAGSGGPRQPMGGGPASVATALFSVGDGRLVFADRAWMDLAAAAGADPGDPAAIFPSLAWPDLLAAASAQPASHAAVPITVQIGGTAGWWDLEVGPDCSTGGGTASLVVVKARDATGTILEQREAEAAEHALAEANARLALAQEAAGIGTWEWDIPADRVAWSPGQFRLHGMDPLRDVPPGFLRWLEMVHPEDRPRLVAAAEGGFRESGRACEVEFRLRRADTGEERWLLALGRVMAADAAGRPARLLGVNLDITERRAEETARRAAEERLRLASEAAGLGVWEYDLRTHASWLSPGYLALYGLPAVASGTLDIEGWLAAVHPDDRARMRAATFAMERTGRLDEEFRIHRADTGEMRWIHSKAAVVRQRGDGPVLIGVNHDVTARRLALDAAAERDQRLRLAFAAAGIFAWDWDVATGRVEWSEAGEAALGLQQGGFPGTIEAFRALVHPDDAPAVEAALQRALTGQDRDYVAEFRMRRGDGTWRRTMTRGTVLRDRDGRPVRLFGVDHDISARAEAEAALAEAQRRREAALDAGGVATWTVDVARGEAEWDPRMCALFGLPARTARLRWEDWANRVHPDELEAVSAAYAAALAEGRRFTLEYRLHPAAAGGERWVRVAGEGEADAATGALLRVRGVATDVTARKTAELAARTAMDELEAVYATAPVGLCVLDAQTGFTRINASLAAVNGFPVEAHLGRRVRDLVPGIADAVEALHRRVFETGEPVLGIEITGETPARPGVQRVWEEDWLPLHDPRTGAVTAVHVVAREVTEERALRAALAASEERYRDTFEQAAVGVAHVALDGRWLRANRRLCGMLGYTEAELLEGHFQRVTHPADLEADLANVQRLLAGEADSYAMEKRYLRKDGTSFWAELTVSLLRDAAGAPLRFVSVVQDVSERKAAEAALAELMATLDLGAFMARDLDGAIRHWSAGCARLFGWSAGEAVGRRAGVLLQARFSVPPEEIAAALERDGTWTGEARYRTRDGRDLVAVVQKALRRTGDGALVLEALTDVTEQRAAETALAESEAFARRISDVAPSILYVYDLAAKRNVWANRETFALLGYAQADFETMAGGLVERLLHPDDRAAYAAHVERLLAQPGDGIAELEYRFRRADGSWVWLRSRDMVFRRDADGRPLQIIGAALDVTDYRNALAALEASEARFRALVGAMPQIAFVAGPDGAVEFVNARFGAYTGLSSDTALTDGWAAAMHPEDRPRLLAAWQAAVEGGSTYEAEERIRGRDGTYRWFLARAEPLRDEAGRVLRWFGTATDISDIVAAREAAAGMAAELERRVAERTRALSDAATELQAEMRRRETAQAALLQSQKLEALGQVTSGVAHDFNNLLAALLGSYRLLERRLEGNAAALDILRQGRHAAERGARLVAQLLAFARREELQPTLTSPAEAIRGAEELICHTAGPEVRCSFHLDAAVWPVLVDPVRLETVLLNLAANARDAMPGGGEIAIQARNADQAELPRGLPRGREFVRIAVADTGAGMDAETLRRATEPFFTTKPRGKGTGLGLASANALATGSGGMLRLTSTPGAGTTVELFLPRAALLSGSAEEAGGRDAGVLDPARHGSATILVVEDDDAVRPVTSRLLRELGYAVVEAPNAEAAEAAAHAAPVDMVVTDVDLGGAPGPVLAARLRRERPGLPVLFVTGHGDAAALDGAPVLRKPFTDADLARAVLRGLKRLRAAEERPTAAPPLDRLRRWLRSPEHREVHARWFRLREAAAGAIPAPGGFDPDDLPPAIRANSYLVEVLPVPEGAEAGAPDFRFLHLGEALVDRLGRSLVGETVGTAASAEDGWSDELGGSVGPALGRCAWRRLPVFDYAAVDLGEGHATWLERLLLPLSADGVGVTHLLGLVLRAAGRPPWTAGHATASGGPGTPRSERSERDGAAPRFDMPGLARAVERLTPAEIDSLPFGAIRLDPDDRVTACSASERRRSGLRGDAVGRGFVPDIAPCMDDPDVRARIARARARGRLNIAFGYVGDMPGAAEDVELHVRVEPSSDGGTWIFLSRTA